MSHHGRESDLPPSTAPRAAKIPARHRRVSPTPEEPRREAAQDWVKDQEADIAQRLLDDRDEAEHKALDALARYKFQMFGYWAGVWVHLNRIIGDRRPSPFSDFVKLSREKVGAPAGGVYAQFVTDGDRQGDLKRFLAARTNQDGTVTLAPAEVDMANAIIDSL